MKKQSKVKKVVLGVYTALVNFMGLQYAVPETRIHVPNRKHHRKPQSWRTVAVRNLDEVHLYGNKLARKAFRKTMTIQCARL